MWRNDRDADGETTGQRYSKYYSRQHEGDIDDAARKSHRRADDNGNLHDGGGDGEENVREKGNGSRNFRAKSESLVFRDPGRHEAACDRVEMRHTCCHVRLHVAQLVAREPACVLEFVADADVVRCRACDITEHERSGKRPRFATGIANIVDAHADFFEDFARDRTFGRFTRLDESRKRRVETRWPRRLPPEKRSVTIVYEYDRRRIGARKMPMRFGLSCAAFCPTSDFPNEIAPARAAVARVARPTRECERGYDRFAHRRCVAPELHP